MARRERQFRGISARAAKGYLENLGGERVGEDVLEGEGWRAAVSEGTVDVGPTFQLTEVTVEFEGEPAVLDPLIEDFARKAMRAGG